MTDLSKFHHKYAPIKYFLNSYRALSDGRYATLQLEQLLKGEQLIVSEWKVMWVGACSILRAAVGLFQVDAQSCINKDIRQEIRNEWDHISKNKSEHPIFWEFLRKERNNIMHGYEWGAYEVWLDGNDEVASPALSLLYAPPSELRSVLRMRSGTYAGQDSLALINQSAVWVEDRINSAIKRAGFEPDEYRNIFTFDTMKDPSGTSVLGGSWE